MRIASCLLRRAPRDGSFVSRNSHRSFCYARAPGEVAGGGNKSSYGGFFPPFPWETVVLARPSRTVRRRRLTWQESDVVAAHTLSRSVRKGVYMEKYLHILSPFQLPRPSTRSRRRGMRRSKQPSHFLGVHHKQLVLGDGEGGLRVRESERCSVYHQPILGSSKPNLPQTLHTA